MPDVFTKEKRSEVMSRIRKGGNKSTELRLVTLFRQFHITGWRRNQKVFGNPDFIFRRQKIAVFVDGCFWHRCRKCYCRPSTNQSFWDAKIAKNRARDRLVNRELKKMGWQVVRIWEHELNEPTRALSLLCQMLKIRNSGDNT